MLKLDQVHFYDLYVNLVDVPERDYPFEQGRELVLNGVKPFGPDYVAIMQQAFDSRWIDVYENACASRITTAATTSIATPTAIAPPPPSPSASWPRSPARATNG